MYLFTFFLTFQGIQTPTLKEKYKRIKNAKQKNPAEAICKVSHKYFKLKIFNKDKIIHIAILIFVYIIHQEGGEGEDLHHFLVAKISHYFLGQIQLAKK